MMEIDFVEDEMIEYVCFLKSSGCCLWGNDMESKIGS